MEIEGFGASLTGRDVWIAEGRMMPWEFLRDTQYSMRVLIRGTAASSAEAEADWTCVWNPAAARDWSCIATCIKSIGSGSCLLVFDQVDKVPWTFWQYIDSIKTHIRVTRVWIHAETPPFVPDAVFLSPTRAAAVAARVFSSLPARGGHAEWQGWGDEEAWNTVVTTTYEQGLGLVVSDIEEGSWTLMWHRPEDSRLSLEKRVARGAAWVQMGIAVLGQ
jgi:hypothetical protein